MARRTLTFLMTDIVGSTRLWEQHPSEMVNVIADHDALVEAVVTAHRGRLIKSKGEGDSTFSVFENATDGITASVAIQDQISNWAWPDATPIKVRIAVHTGEAEDRGGDFYGPTINRCARLREVGHGGQILASAVAKELTRSTALSFQDLGMHRLRDLQSPEQIFQVDHADQKAKFPVLRSLNVRANNLPLIHSSFIGREKVLARLHDSLRHSQLTTLLGPGGVGKTRVALQAGADFADQFDGGVWFVDLVPARNLSDVASSIMQALALTMPTGTDLSLALREEFVTGLPKLIVLDNCEQVSSPVTELVADALRASNRVRFLVTSREPLKIAGESIIRVEGLEIPYTTNLDEVEKSEAVSLFVDRARSRSSSFELVRENAASVVSVCRRLDGIPLAIEQAAALVETFTPAQLDQRLEQRFDILTSAKVHQDPRQRTLTATIEWSLDLLSPADGRCLSRLAKLPSTFDGRCAEILFEGVSENPLETLHTLVEKCLVSSFDSAFEKRFRVFEMVKQTPAVAALDADPHALDCLSHRWLPEVSDLAQAGFSGEQNGLWMDKIDLDLPLIRMAIDQYEPRDRRFAKAVFGFRRYWLQRGLVKEGVAVLERALGSSEPLEEALLGDICNTLGAYHWTLDDPAAARNRYSQALDIWEKIHQTTKRASTLTNLAILEEESGNFEVAERLYRESIQAHRDSTNDSGELLGLINLGKFLLDRGRLEESMEVYQDAFWIATSAGDQARIAIVRAGIASANFLLGNRADWKEQLIAALKIWAKAPNPRHVIAQIDNVAEVLIEVEKLEEAASLLGAFEGLSRKHRIKHPENDLVRRKEMISQVKDLMKSEFGRRFNSGRSWGLETTVLSLIAAVEFC